MQLMSHESSFFFQYSRDVITKLHRTNGLNKKARGDVTFPIIHPRTNVHKDDNHIKTDTVIARRRKYEDKLALRHMASKMIYNIINL